MISAQRTIVFIINSLEYGGAQRVFVDDANAFATEGNHVMLFVLYGGVPENPLHTDIVDAVQVIYLKARSPYDLSAVRTCTRVVRESGARIFFSTLNDGNIFARWVALRTGARLFQREANTLGSKTTTQKLLDVLFCWVPYRFLVVSREAQATLERLLPMMRNRIVFFPNAVSLPDVPPHFSNQPARVLAVGRLTEQKDYATLVRALSILRRRGISFSAVFVGEGSLREPIETLVQDEGLVSDVTFTGHIPHERVLGEYAKADIFVSTSRWEGSPNVLLEAMSYGLPSVSSAVGGVVDIITDHKDGLLVSANDEKGVALALEELLSSEQLRCQVGSAARVRIERDFSREARMVKLRAIVTGYEK